MDGIGEPEEVGNEARRNDAGHGGGVAYAMQRFAGCAKEVFCARRDDAKRVAGGIGGDRRGAGTLLETTRRWMAVAENGKVAPYSHMEGVVTLVNSSNVDKFDDYALKVLEYNQRIQKQNRAPSDFPTFVRDKFDIAVIADGYSVSPEGLIYIDVREGSGALPRDGQEVTFQYVAYNESGARIDSSYQKGAAAKTRLGINGLIPGFELGLKTMRPGGQRRMVVPPALGPPVGPSTFFSAKQCEVFDVELLEVKDCRLQQVGMFSKFVCG